MTRLRHSGTLPTSSCALVSLAEMLGPENTPSIPVLLKTYLRADVARHDLSAVVQAERTALVRLSTQTAGNLARLITAAVTPTALTLTMHRAPGKPAFHLPRPLPPVRTAGIVKQLCDALQRVHAADIVHADVTLRNVIVDENNSDAVCLVDFGSCFVRGGIRRDPARTTSAHVLAPELLSGRQPDPSADVWALGVFTWTLLFGGPGPFGGAGSDAGVLQQLQRLADGGFDIGVAFDDAVAAQEPGCGEAFTAARDFVVTCLSRDVTKRFCRISRMKDLAKTKWSEVVDYRRIKLHPFLRLVPER